MRLRMTGNIDFNGADDLLFLGFHGFGNEENEMIRIIDALAAGKPAGGNAKSPNYLSFRGTYDRPYIGTYYWYPDGCSVEERRRECSAVGAEVVRLLDAPVYARFRKVLIGFSQGGYLSYRMVAEHPGVFDAAVLMSPSFKGEEADGSLIGGSSVDGSLAGNSLSADASAAGELAAGTSNAGTSAVGSSIIDSTRFALCYGSEDHTIPAADQRCAREKLAATGNCTYFEYPGMGHNICDQEIADLRVWLGM